MREGTPHLKRLVGKMAATEADLRAEAVAGDPFAATMAEWIGRQRRQGERVIEAREERAKRRCTGETTDLFGKAD